MHRPTWLRRKACETSLSRLKILWRSRRLKMRLSASRNALLKVLVALLALAVRFRQRYGGNGPSSGD